MWETRSVELSVDLPGDVADQAEEVRESDPDFLSRVVLYGLTRRSIYRHLRETVDPEAVAELDATRAAAAVEERKCRVCGCTEDDCSGCIERTGYPCRWVEDDLCSACEGHEERVVAENPDR